MVCGHFDCNWGTQRRTISGELDSGRRTSMTEPSGKNDAAPIADAADHGEQCDATIQQTQKTSNEMGKRET